MPKDTRAGLEINWMQRGQGEPALLAHCTLAHHKAWTGILAGLGRQLDMIAFDMPDHGESDDTPVGQEMQRVAADVIHSFLDVPRHLIAHSFGATAAILAAIEAPEMVRSLTLVEPVLFSIAKGSDAFHEHDVAFLPFATAWAKQDMEGAAKAFIELWGDGRSWADLPDEQKKYITDRIHVVPLQSPSVYTDVNNLIGAGRLETLTMPATLIYGANSPSVAGEICKRILARLPDGQEFVVDGAGHMSPITHPRQVARLIKAALPA